MRFSAGMAALCFSLCLIQVPSTAQTRSPPPSATSFDRVLPLDASGVEAGRMVAQAMARQGDALFVRFAAAPEYRAFSIGLLDPKGQMGLSGKAFPLPAAADGDGEAGERAPRQWLGIIGLTYEATTGPRVVLAVSTVQPEDRAPLAISALTSVVARDFPTETIHLNPTNTALRVEPDPKKTAEAVAIQAVYATTDPASFWSPSLSFVSPIAATAGAALPPRSAGFGDRRRYVYSNGGEDSTWHNGIDFAVPVGTPVLAPARGRIAFAGMRIVTGNTIVIEHLPGLYSVMMHLSRIEVEAGALVEAGAELGLSGMTGLATGPHLHWEMRAEGRPVDPDWFLSNPGGPPSGPVSPP